MPTGAAAPRARGQVIEQAAEAWLQQQGLQTVARNFQCRSGEIDLVMQHRPSTRQQSTLVFVEVRFRKTDNFGSPVESVTASKQRKLLQTAQFYLLQHPQWRTAPCRFDIVAVRPGDSGLNFEWIANAFGA
ncbi:MAG: YraN family protein [Pseudomonadales bacterium]|nr:YraN family protein [Pseudomonadales bacterium]